MNNIFDQYDNINECERALTGWIDFLSSSIKSPTNDPIADTLNFHLLLMVMCES
jgi:hypothetical protein